jgi:hypothetical protein
MKFDQHPDFFTDEDDDTEKVIEQEPSSPMPKSEDNTTPHDSINSEPPAAEPQPIPQPSRSKWRRVMAWFITILIGALLVAFYFRFVSPYATDIRSTGIVYNVEHRGLLFKTYECNIATSSAIVDTIQPYNRTDFSIANSLLAHRLQEAQLSGAQVEITYSRYLATLPWRGASCYVITGVSVR